MSQIAAKVGVSPQIVRQILVSENLPTLNVKPSVNLKPLIYVCNHCSRKFSTVSGKPRLFCSPECRKNYYQATLRCDECGKLYNLRYSKLRQAVMRGYQHFYCSRVTKGRATGQKYGFIAPENICGPHNKGQPSKWLKFATRIGKMLRQGKSLNSVLVELGIPDILSWVTNLRTDIIKHPIIILCFI